MHMISLVISMFIIIYIMINYIYSHLYLSPGLNEPIYSSSLIFSITTSVLLASITISHLIYFH